MPGSTFGPALAGVDVDRWWGLSFVEFLALVCVPAALLPAVPLLGS